MGVGYSASPLHRINYLDTSAARPVARGENPTADLLAGALGGAAVQKGASFRRPAKANILTWRDRIARKYRDQLGEDLSWDEDSSFEQSEDVATSADMLLRYVAAVLDQRGQTAARALVGMAKKPSPSELEPVFAEAGRRGFGGRFPQLLLGVRYWLPFRRHMIIEEPNWAGTVERYGSLFRLVDEVKEVRVFIAGINPSAIAWTADRPTPGNVLAAAWQASDTVSRLSAVAVAQHLPFWTTG